MTILFVTHYSGFYGANKSLLTVIYHLRERYGINPIVLLPSKGIMCNYLDEKNIPYIIHHYYWWVNDNHGIFQWLLNKRKQLLNIFRVKDICKQLHKYEIDLVYSNSVTINIGMFLAKKLCVPHIWHFRESLVQFNLSLSLSLSLSLLRKPQNAKYILISDYMMNYYRSYLPQDRMTRIYNGVSLPESTERKTENTLKERLKVAIIGVVCAQKNQLELLKAQSLLHQQGIDIDTYIIGTNKKEYLQQVETYIQKHDLSQYVHIMDHQDDIFAILQEMNLGIVCATDEAFGRTTIEFMLMKMPVVVSNSGANAELIRNEQDGYIYPSGDANALANAIKRYATQPELLHLQGKNAYQYAIDNFSAKKNADLIYSEIQKIMNK